MKIDGVTIGGRPMTDEQTAALRAVMDEALALNQHPNYEIDAGEWIDHLTEILDGADEASVARSIDPTDIRNRLVLLIAVACAAVASFDGETK